MDFLSGFAGSLTHILSGVATTVGQVGTAVQQVQATFNPPAPATLAPVGGITYGPYQQSQVKTSTLVVLALASWFFLFRRR